MNGEPTEIPANASRQSNRWIRIAKTVVRLLVIVLVAWGLTRAVQKGLTELRIAQQQLNAELDQVQQRLTRLQPRAADHADEMRQLRSRLQELRRQRFTVWQLRPQWMLVSAALYFLATVPSWVYWHWTLRAMQQQPNWWKSLRAYSIGHLGKYVPGKALVVIIRARLVGGPGVDATVAGTAVFVETLTTMAVGATLAAAILMFYARHWMLLLIALGMMLAAGLPTVPPVFRRLVAAFQVHRANPRILELLDGLNYRLLARGWLVLCLAWLAYGLSLWATLMALPGVTAIPLDQLPLLTACVALAVVAGFLSLIPGGAGVRELVVTTLLAPMYGNAIAVSGAVLLRLIWLLSELVISSILYFADAFTGKRHADVVDRRSNL